MAASGGKLPLPRWRCPTIVALRILPIASSYAVPNKLPDRHRYDHEADHGSYSLNDTHKISLSVPAMSAMGGKLSLCSVRLHQREAQLVPRALNDLGGLLQEQLRLSTQRKLADDVNDWGPFRLRILPD